MESLHLRSDGYAETPSGSFATVMRHSSGVRNGQNWFRFKTNSYQDRITLEWPTTSDVVVVSKDIVDFLEKHRYARPLTADEIDGYNAAVAEAVGDAPEPDPAETPPADPNAPTGQNEAGQAGSSEPPPPAIPPVPPVATDGTESADGSKTPEQLAAEQILASMTKPKKG